MDRIWLEPRPKGRAPRWVFVVEGPDRALFDSRWVSVRYSTREGAEWTMRLVRGLAGTEPGELAWKGDLHDDCWAAAGPLWMHAERMNGPSRGGIWYCSVRESGTGRLYFHTGDRLADGGAPDVVPRSGRGARWLCELVVSAVSAGLMDALFTKA